MKVLHQQHSHLIAAKRYFRYILTNITNIKTIVYNVVTARAALKDAGSKVVVCESLEEAKVSADKVE